MDQQRLTPSRVILSAVALLCSCVSSNPFEYEVVPGIDDLLLPADEIELLGPRIARRASVVIAPIDSAYAPKLELGEAIRGDLSDILANGCSASLVGDDDAAQAVLSEQVRQASVAYSDGSLSSLGGLEVADYIAQVEVSAAKSSSHLEVIDFVDDEGNRIRDSWWESEAAATLTLSVVDVSNGSVVHQAKSNGSARKRRGKTMPSNSDLEALVVTAAQSSVTGFAPGLLETFPYSGYIAQLRGEQTYALVTCDQEVFIPVGTNLTVNRPSTVRDPLSGVQRVQLVKVGELRVSSNDSSGSWCRVRSGSGDLMLGMDVQSQ